MVSVFKGVVLLLLLLALLVLFMMRNFLLVVTRPVLSAESDLGVVLTVIIFTEFLFSVRWLSELPLSMMDFVTGELTVLASVEGGGVGLDDGD